MIEQARVVTGRRISIYLTEPLSSPLDARVWAVIECYDWPETRSGGLSTVLDHATYEEAVAFWRAAAVNDADKP